MTPEEAIEVLSNELIVITDMIEYCRDFEKESDLALAYRVKRKEAHKIAITALKEIQQYREIGTVEECREAVEKQKPKKPRILSSRGGKGGKYCVCPRCNGVTGKYIPYCRSCGQAIQWDENLEGMEDERD